MILLFMKWDPTLLSPWDVTLLLEARALGLYRSPDQAALFLSPAISQSSHEARCDSTTGVLENHYNEDTSFL